MSPWPILLQGAGERVKACSPGPGLTGMVPGVECRCGGVPSPLLTHFWLSLHAELNALQDELRDEGFVVLGFPSNQFGKQEPGQNSEILPALK